MAEVPEADVAFKFHFSDRPKAARNQALLISSSRNGKAPLTKLSEREQGISALFR
ncbi:hypothetical protein [Thermopetrobacter sp. TC1]|uniref:hypothetical protein n=1 Tax=Thermopetrobacter sp. TC1 TaxID=1495045 RepID=UPI0012E01DB0|nr:hypothetical protein [Thermopetrobacter sp. TC1]